ncbi:RAD51-associated protein 1 [Ixodes scapularis]|uniref:RAD51-associated protein 1 n=1 Tax=Ixodes scapularis TaxID=6945 RepID=UPI001C3928FF|nr:RAD51-associated protein 1 [Ixodes scapularis]
MAEGRRSARSHKPVNYAKLDIGSDEDDDFRSAEAANSKRTKQKDKEGIPPKDCRKKETEKLSAKDVDSTLAAGGEIDSKPRRLSLDEKLFDRDLKAALTLSQMEATSRTSAGVLHLETDCVVATENLEVAGEVEVESSCDAGASVVPGMDQVLPSGQELESTPPPDTAGDLESTEASDSSEEEFCSPRSKRRKCSTKQGATTAGRNTPSRPARSVPDVKTASSPATLKQHPTRATIKPNPAEAAVNPPSAPATFKPLSTPGACKPLPTPAACKLQPTSATNKPLPTPAACKPQPTLATIAATEGRRHSPSLPAASIHKNVPRSVPTSSGNRVGTGTSSIRLGLSRKGLKEPLHRVVKVVP